MTRRTLLTIVAVLVVGGGPNVFTQSKRDDAQLHYKVALRALHDDNRRVAIAELRQVLDLDPALAMGHYTLAVVLLESSPAEALEQLDRALQLGVPEKETADSAELRVSIHYQIARRHAAEVFTDQKTGLTWTVRDNGDDVTWKGASEFCSNLTLDGSHDWRLPTINELAQMSDRTLPSIIKIKAPLKVSGCCPWSETKVGSMPVVFAFNFGEAWPWDGPPVNCRALCVRRDK